MKATRLPTVIISLLLFVIFIRPSLAATPEDRWLHGSAGYERALELQRELNVPLVVYFYTDWCPYCHALDNDYLPTAPVQQYLRRVVKVRINPEHGPAEREIAKRYGVRGYPSFFIMRNPAAQPLDVHPFRRGGKHLTPAELPARANKPSHFRRILKSRAHQRRPTTPTDPFARRRNRKLSRFRPQRQPSSPMVHFLHSTPCSRNTSRRSADETHNAELRAALAKAESTCRASALAGSWRSTLKRRTSR